MGESSIQREERSGRTGKVLLFLFCTKCFLMPINKERGSNIIHVKLYFAENVLLLKNLLHVLIAQHQFQLEEKGWMKLWENLVSSHRRSMLENISHSDNLSHSKSQSLFCSGVCICGKVGKDLHESISSVQLSKSKEITPSLPLVQTWSQRVAAIAHHCCQVCKSCAIPSKSERGFLQKLGLPWCYF